VAGEGEGAGVAEPEGGLAGLEVVERGEAALRADLGELGDVLGGLAGAELDGRRLGGGGGGGGAAVVRGGLACRIEEVGVDVVDGEITNV
jgi:hypothetical protein